MKKVALPSVTVPEPGFADRHTSKKQAKIAKRKFFLL